MRLIPVGIVFVEIMGTKSKMVMMKNYTRRKPHEMKSRI